MFDKTNHARKLLDAEQLIAYATMLSDGMRSANGLMNAKEYANMAAGAFGLMWTALDKTYDIITEEGTEFVSKNGLNYPIGSEVAGA